MRMNMGRLAVLMLFICAGSSLYAIDTPVAVMNFANYGGLGLNYLSTSIPESISSYLSGVEGISVLKRNELGNLLDELKLNQSGIVDKKDVERVGKLANAEVIIVGFISGNPDNVFITMKAVQVSTGNVLAEKVVRSPIATLFDSTVIAAGTMAMVVSGQDVAMISVYSVPSGATVYIDGFEVGNTPLEEYSVKPGQHELLLVYQGYVDYQRKIIVMANKHERLNASLTEELRIRRNEIGAGFYYLVPLHNEVQPTLLVYPISYGRTVGTFQPGFEFAFALNQLHDMELISPINTPFIMERQYNLIMFHAFLNMIPFQQSQYVSPYIGVAIGFLHLWDYRINQVFENDEELILDQTSLSLGGKIGVTLFPVSAFRIFIDARFYFQPFPIDRPIFVSQGLGSEMAQMSKAVHLYYFALGGGLKFAF